MSKKHPLLQVNPDESTPAGYVRRMRVRVDEFIRVRFFSPFFETCLCKRFDGFGFSTFPIQVLSSCCPIPCPNRTSARTR